MSMIFGIRKPVGAFVSEQEVLQLAQGTERYALDGTTLGGRWQDWNGDSSPTTHICGLSWNLNQQATTRAIYWFSMGDSTAIGIFVESFS